MVLIRTQHIESSMWTRCCLKSFLCTDSLTTTLLLLVDSTLRERYAHNSSFYRWGSSGGRALVLCPGSHSYQVASLGTQWQRICLPMQRRHEFHPWVRKIPWRRARQPTPIFFPGEPYGERSLWATVHTVAKSCTPLKWLSTHAPDLLHSNRLWFWVYQSHVTDYREPFSFSFLSPSLLLPFLFFSLFFLSFFF